MAITTGDVLRVTAKMSFLGNDVQNVYHLRCFVTIPPTNDIVLGAVANWLDDAYSAVNDIISDQIVYDTINVWNLTDDEFIGETVWPTLTGGAQVGDPLPPQTSALVNFGTWYPKSLGKKFLPVMTDGQTDSDGTIQAASLVYIAAYAAAILLGVVETDWSLEPGNWNELLARFAPWVLANVRDFFATQRRRYVGSGS